MIFFIKDFLDFLETAKSFGDRLLVAVYNNHPTKTLINSLSARMTVLASLNIVDWVTPIEHGALNAFVQELLPDTIVLSHENFKTGHVEDIKVLDAAGYLAKMREKEYS